MALYAIALGSNRRHGRHGAPARVLAAAIAALPREGVIPLTVSPTFVTAPIGPSIRAFANAAALVETPLDPPALLAALKRIERAFGRRRGQRWGARVLDLDILLWQKGRWSSRRPVLLIPHIGLAKRRFVLDPLVKIAPEWPVPRIGTVAQARARLTRRLAIHRSGPGSGP
ncbi:2-amino-4-hydroxy-6-hydroxymethyldihydropteridine diphosphokinase [Sphingomonas sp. MMS24-J13]|uniref:2-amino-4-hydroxy-6- hydroxymethyldihydropteridine diphosphokinase n=1 Tax=Sphingomonas sp. MMS24-J13 TaxID=3238686 RepID=UPI00384F4C2B